MQVAPEFGSFAVVDVETSGLRRREDRVLSVAVTTLAPDGGVADSFATLVDPGCDPGPVHVHGITRDVLRGAPDFAAVRDRIAEMLTDRVMVAHNASFDYDFLASEFARTGATPIPVQNRLCTLALARRMALPVPNCRLETLAVHYGIRQLRAHSASDDVRVLTGVLRGLLADSARLGVSPPLLACPPRADDFRARAGLPPSRSRPKPVCAFAYPGRLQAGAPLVQGMKATITGDTSLDRNVLIEKAEEAGLEVTGSVSGKTSVLVANDPRTGSTKLAKAAALGTPVVDEAHFLALLAAVRPGVPKTTSVPTAAKSRSKAPQQVSSGPLAGRRILVLGGTHDEAAALRTRITALGGSAAVNLSASVTDVVVLPGAERLPRAEKARELGLPIHPGLPGAESSAPTVDAEITDLVRGQVIDLPPESQGTAWTARISWNSEYASSIDVVAFAVDETYRVDDDSDFVFYNQPTGTGVSLAADGPAEQSITIDPAGLPNTCVSVVVCAALDDPRATFGDVGALEVEVSAGEQGALLARTTLDAATTERTMILTQIYRRGESWRVRSVGQGYDTDLAALARRYGVEVE